MATTTIINDLIDLNQTGNTTALKGCVGTNAQQPAIPTINVQYLVVGGGGGGNGSGSGGAGAGAFVAGTVAVPNNTAVNITVGQGGPGKKNNTLPDSSENGQDSGFYTIQGQGGGGAAKRADGSPGGSGAGGGASGATAYNGGSSTAYGNDGGDATSSTAWSTGGGGGAGSVGGDGTVGTAGAGGAGSTTTIISTTNANASNANVGEQDGGNLYFAGGGGGGGSDSAAALPYSPNLGGSGGLGGGGDGTGQCSDCPGGNGTLNTGGGGGGSSAASVDTPGGYGGSGVVILRYANTATETISGSLAGGITTGTTSECNYPATASAVNLFQFNDDVTDTCGNNDGTAVNPAYATGNFGKAYDFSANTTSYSGTSSFVTFSDDMSKQNDFSWSFWLKSTGTISNYATIISFYGSYLNYIYFNPGISNIYMELGDGGATSFDTGMTSGNNWYHCVLTKSSTAGRAFYVNGSSVFSDSNTTNGSAPSRTGNAIGMHWGSGSAWQYPLNGDTLIDQFRIFNSGLTADQVGMLYGENIGATKFTESSDTVLVFKGGSGTISLTDSSLPGPKVGDLRTNTDQSSNSSASAMEHFISTGWRVFDATPNPSSGICNYPTTATALYQLNDNANDTCVSAYNGTASNMTWSTGKFGNCGIFNGNQTFASASRILLPDAVDQFPMSVSCWIYLNGLASSGLGAVVFEGQQGMGLNFTGGNPTYLSAQAQNSQTGQVDSNSALTTGQWYFVVGIFNSSSSAELYIDNVAQSGSSSIDYLTSDENAIGARDHYGYPGTFNGKIDQLRIFPSVLTSAQMTQLYNET